MEMDIDTPLKRPRRLRIGARMRALAHETDVNLDQLVQGVFVVAGSDVDEPIGSMPGIRRRSVDRVIPYLQGLADLGVEHVMLFGVPDTKDAQGHGADAEDGIIQQTLRAAKQAEIPLTLIADTCFCEYTEHGHCGVLSEDEQVVVDNDATLARLASVAVSQAEAGADVIAPSGMTDGTVRVVREALDRHGYARLPIMMYSVKYASAFYGPFREAAEGAPAFGDRRAYQMDPRNGREARREAALDVAEGADMLIVKPAFAYMDVIRRVAETVDIPVVAYNVSGEYAMIKAAAERGWLDEREAVSELFTGLRRAGAQIIVSYFVEAWARWQQARSAQTNIGKD